MADISECFGHVFQAGLALSLSMRLGDAEVGFWQGIVFFFSGPTGVPYFGMFKLP